MATKKRKPPQKGRRAPLIQVTIQRRPKRRMRLFRSLAKAIKVAKAAVKGEPVVRYKGDDKPARSPKSKSVGGRGGRPIRNPGWQGPDPYQGGAVWDGRWEDPRDVDAEELDDYAADDIEEDDAELEDVELEELDDVELEAFAFDGDAT